ncbi:MAG: hypothetical protein U9R06_01295 [Patescibacteria group bacterium]|nr:hypothetical protein [Patescibacteria group bacterium]
MTEINFLDDKNDEQDDNQKKKLPAGVKYSKPEMEARKEKINPEKPQADIGMANNKVNLNNNLPQKRKKVLSAIKQDKHDFVKAGSRKNNFISTVKNKLYGVLRISKKNAKKDKEILAESKDIFEKTKKERNNNPKPESKDSDLSKGDLDKTDDWASAEVIKTNLIQDEVTVFIEWPKYLKILFGYLTIVFFLVLAGHVGLFVWEMKASQQKDVMSVDIENIKQKIIGLDKQVEEIQAFQKKLALSASLLNRHIYWTIFFEFLEENTLSNVYYSGGFSGDTSGQYILSANTDSFKSISDQIMVMRGSQDVIEVSADSGSSAMDKGSSEEKVAFQIRLNINPGIFTSAK